MYGLFICYPEASSFRGSCEWLSHKFTALTMLNAFIHVWEGKKNRINLDKLGGDRINFESSTVHV